MFSALSFSIVTLKNAILSINFITELSTHHRFISLLNFVRTFHTIMIPFPGMRLEKRMKALKFEEL